MTKVQWVPGPCFRSEDDEFMVFKGCLAENYALFGRPTNAFDLTRTPSRPPKATRSPRRARPERSSWFGRHSNSFSGFPLDVANMRNSNPGFRRGEIAQTPASGSHPHAHRSQRVASADPDDWDHEAVRFERHAPGTASCAKTLALDMIEALNSNFRKPYV